MELVCKEFYKLSLDELYSIYKLRCEVFIVEQNCPYLDIDDVDKNSYHMFYKNYDEIIAYLRVIPKNMYLNTSSIGRVIVKKEYRGKNIGLILLKEAIKLITDLKLDNTITIHAQTYAIPFYNKVGFKAIGNEFLEDGIPHFTMELKI